MKRASSAFKTFQIYNTTQKTTIAYNVEKADTFLSRMVGLLKRESLREGEGLLITHCQSIHMVFMRFPIDVIFVDRSNKVVGLVRDIKPFCFSPVFMKASYAIELPVNAIDRSQTQIGDWIQSLPV